MSSGFMIDGFLRNSAMMVILALGLVLTRERLSGHSTLRDQIAYGLVFGFFSLASIILPVEVDAGIRIDLRIVPLLYAGPLCGLLTATTALLVTVVGRLAMGGEGQWVGTSLCVLAFLAGSSVAWWQGWRPSMAGRAARPMAMAHVLVLSACASAIMAWPGFMIWGLTQDGSFVLGTRWFLSVVLVPMATLIVGLLLRFDQRQRALENRLRASDESMAVVAANIPGIIYRRTLDENGGIRFVYVSERARDILGVPANDLVKDAGTFLSIVHPDDRARMKGIIQVAVQGLSEPVVSEYRVVRPDGAVRWILARSQVNAQASAQAGCVLADGVAFDITDRKEAELAAEQAAKRAAWLWHHDALTGLPNRLALLEKAAELLAGADGARVVLVLVNLHDSAAVNELFGQAAGDARLVEAAHRLHAVEPSGLVARAGGDEFAVLFTHTGTPEERDGRVTRLAMRLSEPFNLAGQVVPISGRSGFAVAPDDALTAERLFQAASIALDSARDERDTAPVRFTAALEQRRSERRMVEAELSTAIAHGDLRLVWQPVVRCSDRQIIGREALVRWDRPEHGSLPPDVFVPMAEAAGLWAQLDSFVLREACRTAASIPGDAWIAVNISGAWFRVGDLVGLVTDVLRQTGLPASRLFLEVTETVMIEERDGAAEVLRRLQAMGVRFAIDDFGAVYSSLGYLHRLPVQKIKLDRSFVEDLERDSRARSIVRAIIALCRDLEIGVVAEGVETEAQLAWLTEVGCFSVQGFHVGRPGPWMARPDAVAAPASESLVQST